VFWVHPIPMPAAPTEARFSPPWGCRLVRALLWWPVLSLIGVVLTPLDPATVTAIVAVALVTASLLVTAANVVLPRCVDRSPRRDNLSSTADFTGCPSDSARHAAV
jgi:hypothetical protein